MYQPKYSITNKLMKSINRIVQAHALIINAPLKPKWEAGLRYQALVKSVHSSTHLEGNPLTEQEVDQVLRGKKPKRQFRKRDILEVTNYREVLQFISDHYGDPKLVINESTIRHLHKLCVQNIEGMVKEAGKYRTIQNYIVSGASRKPIYTPPPAQDVPALMKNLVDWIQQAEKEELSPFIIAAIAHYDLPPKKWTQRRVGFSMKTSSKSGGVQWVKETEKSGDLTGISKYRRLRWLPRRGIKPQKWPEALGLMSTSSIFGKRSLETRAIKLFPAKVI